ncbi:MAG TPA: hypothetical protein VGY91_12560 [Chthoniobacterales bacterium]|nr:hypothetical protein [Chthoniobacterales bacterium]
MASSGLDHDREFQRGVSQAGDQFIAREVMQQHLYAWHGFFEMPRVPGAISPLWEPGRSRGATRHIRHEPEHAPFPPIHRRVSAARGLPTRKSFPSAVSITPHGLRRKVDADLILQVLDPSAQRRLRDS